MAEANGLNPTFPGAVTAAGFRNKIGTGIFPQKVRVATNGTTPVNVFGTTNGFSGSFVGIRTISQDTTAANITFKQNVALVTETSVAVVAKGTTDGGVLGSAIGLVGTAFTATGTATIVSSQAAGNAIVEIEFIVATPENP